MSLRILTIGVVQSLGCVHSLWPHGLQHTWLPCPLTNLLELYLNYNQKQRPKSYQAFKEGRKHYPLRKEKKDNPIKDIDVSRQEHYKLSKSYATCSQGGDMDDINKKYSN